MVPRKKFHGRGGRRGFYVFSFAQGNRNNAPGAERVEATLENTSSSKGGGAFCSGAPTGRDKGRKEGGEGEAETVYRVNGDKAVSRAEG